MTSPTTHDSPAQTSIAKKSGDEGRERPEQSNGDRAAAAPTELADLARAQQDLTQEVRLHVARQLVEHESDGDEALVGKLLTDARSDVQQRLLHQEQERARRELADAARNGEDAVAGVVHSVTTIVRSMLPAALVRPEELIEATYSLADQGLRVGRRLALTVTGSARELVPLR